MITLTKTSAIATKSISIIQQKNANLIKRMNSCFIYSPEYRYF